LSACTPDQSAVASASPSQQHRQLQRMRRQCDRSAEAPRPSCRRHKAGMQVQPRIAARGQPGEWVTSRSAAPASRQASSSRSSTAVAGRLVEVAGRLVGQHHGGRAARHRPMATRCCWPPDSSSG
jgi:hypothetical protein